MAGRAVPPAPDGPPSLGASSPRATLSALVRPEGVVEQETEETRDAVAALGGEAAWLSGAEVPARHSGSGLVTRAAVRRRPHDLRPGEEVDDGRAGAPPLDDATVEMVKKGHPASWEAAYLAYGRALMGYLVLRLQNRDDAADALSETFARAIDKASSFRGDSYAFRAWLFSIARNVSTDQHRFRSRIVVLGEQPESEDRQQPSGEDIAILKEDVVELRRGFVKLTPAEQEILWLRVCAGLPAAEVGQVLGKKPGTVRMQQLRALQALRVQVGA